MSSTACLFPLASSSISIVYSQEALQLGFNPEELSTLTGAYISTTADTAIVPSCTIGVWDASCASWTKLFRMATHLLCFDPEHESFHILFGRRFIQESGLSEGDRISCYRLAIISGILKLLLQGAPISLIHGAVLSSPKGNILFTGQSGMGKSTTSRRWLEAGGASPADDMSLLEFRPDGIWLHPLPTWSRCNEQGIATQRCAFSPALPLDSLIILNRDPENESIREVSATMYFSSIYAAIILFNSIILHHLPEGPRKKIVSTLQMRADQLCDTFPHRGFFACLDSDINNSMKGIL